MPKVSYFLKKQLLYKFRNLSSKNGYSSGIFMYITIKVFKRNSYKSFEIFKVDFKKLKKNYVINVNRHISIKITIVFKFLVVFDKIK